MKKVLITGANSYIGTSVEKWLINSKEEFLVDTADTFDGKWKQVDFSKYDTVFHVAAIVHVKAKKSMESLYNKINTDLPVDVAKFAKLGGVKQFVFMSTMGVYQDSKSLQEKIITKETKPNPKGFYGNSKLKAEIELTKLEDESFKVVILRPPMIYGPNCKGNFKRLVWLADVTPIFPNFHNKRSMLYIDNLCEFVKQIIIRELNGTFFPQNKELADTLEIVKFFAKAKNHRILISKLFNIFVILGSPIINAINKMFGTYYYDPTISKMDFEYQIVSEIDSYLFFLEASK